MGGFFLSASKGAVDIARRFFIDLGQPSVELAVGATRGLLLQKRFVSGHVNLVERDGAQLAGVGTYATERHFGEGVLRELASKLPLSRDDLGDLSGHSAFLLDEGGRGTLYTDKSGTLPVYELRDSAGTHFSTSFLALAAVATKLVPDRQGALEFLNLEATLGSATVFENIKVLPGGTQISLGMRGETGDARIGTREPYYVPTDAVASFDEFVDVARAHVCRLTNANAQGDVDICCDLSGGLDSRTVAALLDFAGVRHSLNTNINVTDPSDHQAALDIAIAEGRPITVYNCLDSKPTPEQEARDFRALDMARDAFRARRTLAYFEAKARRHEILLGGYGGELLRDIYSRDRDVRTVVMRRYTKGISLGVKEAEAYQQCLVDKLERSLLQLGTGRGDRDAERVYYFEKMRNWGGSRIALFNRYAFRYHPLLDHKIVRYLFSVSLDAKANAAFQKRLIALSPRLAGYAYSGQLNSPARSLARRLRRSQPGQLATRWLARSPRLTRTHGGETPESAFARRFPEALARFESLSGVPYAACPNLVIQGRFLTLARLMAAHEGQLVL